MGRGGWLVLACIGAAGAVGLGVWTWFLAGRSLEVMDQMSSVLSGFGTLASLVLGVVGLVVALRSSSGSPDGHKSFRADDASGARVTFGDNSPITDRDR